MTGRDFDLEREEGVFGNFILNIITLVVSNI